MRFGFAFAQASASGDAAHLIALPTNWRYAGVAHAVTPWPTCVKNTGLFSAVFTHAARLLYFTFGFRFFVGSAGWKSVRASGLHRVFEPVARVRFVGDVEAVAEPLGDRMVLVDERDELRRHAEVAVIRVVDAADALRRVPVAGAADHLRVFRPGVRPCGRRVVQEHEPFAFAQQLRELGLQLLGRRRIEAVVRGLERSGRHDRCRLSRAASANAGATDVEERVDVEELAVFRREHDVGGRMLDVRPGDVAAPRVPHLEERLAIVGVAFGDDHHLDRTAPALRDAAAASAAARRRCRRARRPVRRLRRAGRPVACSRRRRRTARPRPRPSIASTVSCS